MRVALHCLIGSLAVLWACTPKHLKPVASAELMTESAPKLEALASRALKDEMVDGKVVDAVSLVSSELFSEGHFHETWRLGVDLDGRRKELVLKVFRTQAKADENAVHYGFAQQYGWPIPKEVVRGASAKPLHDQPFLLMEYVEGGTLRAAVEEAHKAHAGDPSARDQAIGALYGVLGKELGELHHKSVRKREHFDIATGKRLKGMVARCAKEGWCDAGSKAKLEKLGAVLDGPMVAFVHGDLYESQVLMEGAEGVRAFIDLDTAHFDDQAHDVGSMLAHLVLVNPISRKSSWGVDDPTPEETAASARAFLEGYRAGAGIPDEAWADLLARTQAFMWLRMDDLIRDLAGSPHGAPVVKALSKKRKSLLSTDPLAAIGVTQ